MSDTHAIPSDAAQRTLLKQLLRAARDRLNAAVDERIAVIGMAGRYPGAANLDQFWDNLAAGKNCIREVPAERWDWKAVAAPSQKNGDNPSAAGIYTRWGGFIDGVDEFDPLFFNLSPLEAEAMDPQERLFLQTAWHALEDAGYTRKKIDDALAGEVGVFVGVMNSHYEWFNAEARQRGVISGAHSHFWSLANRLSYFLNLSGPSFAVDSACSASLTAIHLACESLRRGECRAAIAGGVNLILHPLHYHKLCLLEMLSPNGECRPFGAGADGFVDGEGVGALLLKPLRAAIADGDQIQGVLLGSAINAGGKTGGYTVPNPQAQRALVERALKRANVSVDTISYVEAHGTGTSLGDPIEMAALQHVFGRADESAPRCAIGSVKSNIGHLESAAGVAGLTKVLLQLRHRTLAPSLNAAELNPKIDWENSSLVLQRTAADWHSIAGAGRRAGVSSFGAGGANAHVVVEEFVAEAKLGAADRNGGPQIIVLSARNEERLQAQAKQLAAFLEQFGARVTPAAANLADVAWTLQLGREAMDARVAFVATTLAEAAGKLRAFVSGELRAGLCHGSARRAGGSLAELLGGDAASRGFVDSIMAQRDGERLARLWVAGAELDWTRWHASSGMKPRIISLPGYPFARERYWLAGGTMGAVAPVTTAASHGVSMPAPFVPVTTFIPEWVSVAKAASERWSGPLTVVAPKGTAEEIARRWVERGQRPGDLQVIERSPAEPTSVSATPRVLWIASESTADAMKEFAQVLAWLQARQARHPAATLRFLFASATESPAVAAVRGLLRTAAAEIPGVNVTCATIIVGTNDEFWSAALDEAMTGSAAHEVRISGAARAVRQWRRVVLPPGQPWKQGGVYVITGGLGGLGKSCARHLVQTSRARLALIGRSALSAEGAALLAELRAVGGEADYFQADLGDREQCERAWMQVRVRFGVVNGILHAAGATRDGALAEKTLAEARAVFAGKVRGLGYLDDVSRGEKLDCVVLFASVSGVLGNFGQADYAAANAFLDEFAVERNRRVERGESSGRTVAIDWPLWTTGGMTLDAAQAARAKEQFGLVPLPEGAGLALLDAAVAAAHPQILAWSGDPGWIERALNAGSTSSSVVDGIAPRAAKDLHAATEAFLQELIAAPIKLNPAQIEPERRFEEYGIDSVMVRAFNVRLEQQLPGLPATLLFEYPTLRALTQHLVAVRGAELVRLFEDVRKTTTLPSALPAIGSPLEKISIASRTDVPGDVADEPIAIVGMSGRYPGARNLEEFWANLAAGRDCVTEVPRERWDAAKYADKAYCQRGGFIADADKFDPLFFGISPLEAKAMDPQERIFLELAWEAVEDAGYTRASLERNTGVFVGVTTLSYALFGPEAFAAGHAIVPSSVPWSLANRVSFVFDLKGPSMPVDTACSASLTALHSACESLRRGECQAALVGGVNLYLHPLKYVVMCQTRMLSRSGHCHSFGEGGDGFIPGEGGGVLVLKPLARAVADGDQIHGLIRGTAVNHGGRTNGYTVPNPRAHADLIRQAWHAAGIDPRTITCIEAHGTGTVLGDPIEVEGLTQAFRTFTADERFCALGSVKSAIGHLESAAGVAGVTKVLLQMKRGQLAPTLHADTPNRSIDFPHSPLVLQRELAPWTRAENTAAGVAKVTPRRAGVSSFGAGGANAHIVLEEYIAVPTAVPANNGLPHVVILSARNSEQLREYARRMRAHLAQLTDDEALGDLAYTLQIGREAQAERLAIVGVTRSEITAALDAWLDGIVSANVKAGRVSANPRASDASEPADIATRWVRGEQVDWRASHAGRAWRRVSAPTYPFARERYWFDDAVPEQEIAVDASTPATNEKPWYARMPGETDFGLAGDEVRLERVGDDIAVVRLNDRANHNMFSERLLRALLVHFSEIQRRPEIKVVIVTGCENVFSMGGTREGLLGLAEQKAQFTDVPFLFRGLLECPVPVIAAVQGHASGGGFLFGLYADLVVLAEEGVYSANFLKYGFTPGMGATLILPEKLGPQLASEMMFTAGSLTGEELLRRGAGVRVRPQKEVLNEALSLAQSLVQKPAAALRELKKELAGRLIEKLPEVLRRELAMHERTFGAPEVRARIEEVFARADTVAPGTVPTAPVVAQTLGQDFDEALEAMRAQRAVVGNVEAPAISSTMSAGANLGGEAESEVRDFIFGLLQRLLHLRREAIDVEASFSQMGLDSISGVEFVRDLNKRFGLNLEAVVLYDHGSVARLAAFVAGVLPRRATRDVPKLPEIGMKTVPAIRTPAPVAVARVESGRVSLKQLGVGAAVLTSAGTPPAPRVTLALPRVETDWPDDAIAVVGLSCRYPGAADQESFWKNLEQGIDAIGDVPEGRWQGGPNESHLRKGGFLTGVDQFDPGFFKLLPVEAEHMEPQQRLFLEESWKALEDGGFTTAALAGKKCGVFVGASTGDYYNEVDWTGREHHIAHAFTGGSPSILAARIAYHLDLTGPSVALDTACSSSLVAVHQACRCILGGDAELALAGGVSLMLTPQTHVMTGRAGMLSPTGRCRPFDQRADGIVIGEGVGVVVLQRLSRARAERRHIYGVIRGSAVNQDGRTNGIMAPSARSQAALLAEAQARAGVRPEDVTFIEAHGTGTGLGDPIEVSALRTTFGAATGSSRCALGSVKSNIGHTMLAAGVAGLIKVLLAMKHRRLPATLHFSEENEHLRLAGSPFVINSQTIDWTPAANGRRIAGVSSFGFSGTNAHVVLEAWRDEAPVMPGTSGAGAASWHPILLSARDEAGLRQRAAELKQWAAAAGAEVELSDVAFTLAHGRHHYAVRRAFAVPTLAALVEQLGSGGSASSTAPSEMRDLCARYERGEEVVATLAASGRMISMPTHPFARRRFWIEPRRLPAGTTKAADSATLSRASSGAPVAREFLKDPIIYVKRLVAAETKLDPGAIDAAADFEACGFNSIVIAGLNRRLESDFGPLPATLFFTYKTIGAIAAYLQSEHGTRLAEILNADNSAPAKGPFPKETMVQAVARPTPTAPGSIENEPIAIIGMNGRFPMADTIDEFWENLQAGRDCISEIPAERWDYRRFWTEGPGKREGIYCKWGGFVGGADKFDPSFFNIAPREARFMDPQERIFLETVWGCLEDAGYTRARLQDPTAPDRRAPVGVFVGVSLTDYQMFGGEAWGRGEIMPVNSQIYALANRVSYYLNLGGPSLPVDTACSSSLYALHLACESIRRGECRMALAGGVNLSLHPNKYLTLCLGQFAASDGRCRAFGEGGDGYVPSEAVGAVLLKPLSAALRDGDQIHAVLRGTAVNHDGKTHGFTVPNPVAQTEVIRLALQRSGIGADAVTYVEAHGTGTALGDPIEVAGLTEAFAADTSRKQFCAIGSVKSNIGHAEAAAGMAQLIKVVLQLKHRTLVPNLLHSARTNPHIDFARTPFRVQLTSAPWELGDTRTRVAGLSSFGVGGVNVHAILEEAPALPPRTAADREMDIGPVILMLSAKSETSLRENIAHLREFLARKREGGEAPRLTEVAYTLQVGREAMPLRVALVVSSIADAISGLAELESQPVGARQGGGSAKNPFGQDAEDRVYLERLMQERKLDKLARLWADGAVIDWEKLWSTQSRPARISLPTYAFQRERYWQFEVTGAAAEIPLEPKPAAVPNPGSWREQVAGGSPEDRIELLTRHVQQMVGELLAFSPPNSAPLDKGLFDLGMESVQNAQLVARLATDTGVELYPTVAFDYPNVRALATYLAHKVGVTPAATTAHAPVTSASSLAAPAPVETFFVQDAWEAANLPPPAAGGVDAGTVLLLAHDDDARTAVIEALRARGDTARVVLVKPGYEFACEREDVFCIDPRVPAHFTRLIETAGARGAARIVHGWSAKPFSTHPEILAAQLERGPYAVFLLTQALMRRVEKGAVRLICAGSRGESIPPHFVALRAMLRSITQENPGYDYRLVECVRENPDGLLSADWSACVDELLRGADAGAEVRHEPGRRLARVLREFLPANSEDRALKERGVYLITGALGGLGTLLAEHLATTCRARLVLAGRSPLEGKTAWLRQLEAMGAEAIYLQADVATRGGAEAMVTAAQSKFGQVDGVVHVAGVLRDAFVPTKKTSDWDAVLAPKVAGTVHLDEATRGQPLQFFAVFSSLTAAVGNAGQSDYAYANSFQEQFIEWRAHEAAEGRRAGKSLAINWPLWADGGMKVDAAMHAFLRDAIGLEPLPAKVGLEVFERALAGTENTFTVLHGNKNKIAPHLKLRLRAAASLSGNLSDLEAALEAELRGARQQLGGEDAGVAPSQNQRGNHG